MEGVTFAFRWISEGTFLMGSPENETGRYSDEDPRHAVTLTSGFWAGATPVTQEQWEVARGKGENPSSFKGTNRPVEQLSWEECQMYAERLNGQIAGLKAQLPTEAQWEYACRAGTESAFNGGTFDDSVMDKLGWYIHSNFVSTHIAGHGALGRFFVDAKKSIKMGDTPSIARLIRGASEDPSKPGWGGKYVRLWDGRKTIFDHLTTEADKAEVFGVTEFVLPVPEGYTSENTASMIFSRGKPPSMGVIEGKVMRFRFSPRDAKVWYYEIKSDFSFVPFQFEFLGTHSAIRRPWPIPQIS